MSKIKKVEEKINRLLDQYDFAQAMGNYERAIDIMVKIEIELAELKENTIGITTTDNEIVIH